MDGQVSVFTDCFGRLGTHACAYTHAHTHIHTYIQAFAICLSSFDHKLACE